MFTVAGSVQRILYRTNQSAVSPSLRVSPSALSHGSDLKYRLIILILHFYDYKPMSDSYRKSNKMAQCHAVTATCRYSGR